jgi:hypothetical protein
MGLSVKDYIRGFERANLCAGEWSMREAREAAREIGSRAMTEQSGRTWILLGSKVCAAFGVDYLPFTWLSTAKTVVLPHPSGRARAWNEPGAFDRAREVLTRAGVLPLPPHPPGHTR